MTAVLLKDRSLDTDTYTRKTQCDHKDGHLQAKERGLEQIFLSQSSGGNNPATA